MESFFYVADDVQTLADGKLLLVGLYADRVLVMNIPRSAGVKLSAETPAGIASLAVVLTLVGLAPGEMTLATRLVLPDGTQSMQQLPDQKLKVVAGGSNNVVLKFSPFIVPQAGTYTLSTAFDGQVIESRFEVRMRGNDDSQPAVVESSDASTRVLAQPSTQT